MFYFFILAVSSQSFLLCCSAENPGFYPRTPEPEVCVQLSATGVRWILNSWNPSGEWNGNTARANIAFAVNKYIKKPMTKLSAQLEEEIIRALLRNSTSTIPSHDLALMIMSLVATRKNPRNFHGIDLADDLLHRVNSAIRVHPFLVLSLCEAHAIDISHLEKIKYYLEMDSTPRNIDMKALALKAAACADSLKPGFARNYELTMSNAAKSLVYVLDKDKAQQNPYTMSLIVQALTAYRKETWNEQKALEYLRNESETAISIAKTYFLELGLNSRSVTFLKELYEGPYGSEKLESTKEISVTITVKADSMEITIIVKIPEGGSFLQAMEKGSEMSNKLKFVYVQNQEPVIFEINKKANDPERNFYWHICRQDANGTLFANRATFSPPTAQFQPWDGEHIILVYTASDYPCAMTQ